MKYFIVNTNRKADPNGHDEEAMLNEEMVALYFDGYKESIERLKNDDFVFLYSNTAGIIAYGQVDGKTCIRNYKGMTKFKGQEYFQHMKNFVKLEHPVSVNEVTKIIGKRMFFMHAFFEMNELYAIPLKAHLSKISKFIKIA